MEIDDDAIWQYTLKPLPLSQLRPANPREQLHWYPEVVSRQFPPFRQFVCPHVTTKRQHFPLVLEITFIGVPLYFVCRIKVSFDSWLCHEWKIYNEHATLLIINMYLFILNFPRWPFLFICQNTNIFVTFKEICSQIF